MMSVQSSQTSVLQTCVSKERISNEITPSDAVLPAGVCVTDPTLAAADGQINQIHGDKVLLINTDL